jgi:thiamine-monophosphate kinase
LAYEHLLRGLSLPDALRNKALTAAYNPHINHDIISALARVGAVTSSMDSSDGLGVTLNTIAKQSGVSIIVDTLPVPVMVWQFARENNLDSMKLAMLGGEEFLIALTVPEEKWNLAHETASNLHVPLTQIGRTQAGEGVVYESKEGYLPVPMKGYDNVKGWD